MEYVTDELSDTLRELPGQQECRAMSRENPEMARFLGFAPLRFSTWFPPRQKDRFWLEPAALLDIVS
jgi:hypothetical protein